MKSSIKKVRADTLPSLFHLIIPDKVGHSSPLILPSPFSSLHYPDFSQYEPIKLHGIFLHVDTCDAIHTLEENVEQMLLEFIGVQISTTLAGFLLFSLAMR
jgi:hypothetical protein